MCAFYQRTDWPAEILISNQNFVCNKYKFTCNNLGGWTRFVACMFPENQDNFTLNSKSVVAIILLGRVAFWQHFNLPLLQDLPKWPPLYLSIPKDVPVWLLFPQIVFFKWPDDSFSNKWPDDFVHQMIRWFFPSNDPMILPPRKDLIFFFGLVQLLEAIRSVAQSRT